MACLPALSSQGAILTAADNRVCAKSSGLGFLLAVRAGRGQQQWLRLGQSLQARTGVSRLSGCSTSERHWTPVAPVHDASRVKQCVTRPASCSACDGLPISVPAPQRCSTRESASSCTSPLGLVCHGMERRAGVFLTASSFPALCNAAGSRPPHQHKRAMRSASYGAWRATRRCSTHKQAKSRAPRSPPRSPCCCSSLLCDATTTPTSLRRTAATTRGRCSLRHLFPSTPLASPSVDPRRPRTRTRPQHAVAGHSLGKVLQR